MRGTTGFRRAGLLAILAAILLPVSGIGTAAADLSVGDTVMLKVPDLGQFPEDIQSRPFTCRAVTEHAYWLVQDTTYVDTEEPLVLWPDYFDQTELDSLTEQFEGGGVDVYGSVTSGLAEPQETVNGDEKLWLVFADVPDIYNDPSTGSQYRSGPKRYVWPADYDGDEATGNNHDIIYINIGVYRDVPQAALKSFMHTVAVPSGLAEYIRLSYNTEEERWLQRGIGVMGQYLAYGFTAYPGNNAGIGKYLSKFEKLGMLNVSLWNSGSIGTANYFDSNQGGAFLLLMYAEQMTSDNIVPAIATSDYAGMMNIGTAISPSADSTTVINEVVIPLYSDFIIANAISAYAEDYEGGKYHYDFLDGEDFEFAMIEEPASLDGELSEYPISTTLVPPMMSPAWSARYFALEEPDSTGLPSGTVYFNGQYNQNNGSGGNYNGKWDAWRIIMADDTTLASIDALTLNDLYNGTFELAGDAAYIVTTNNNPGGTPALAATFSQDTAEKDLLLALMQNPGNSQYIQAYTSLYYTGDWMPTGTDWVGPNLTVTKGDSTLAAEMEPFSGTIWGGMIGLWEAGDYAISCSAWDSLGIEHSKSFNVSCAYSEQEGKVLNLTEARLDLPAGATAPGEMAVLMETDLLGVAVASAIPISGAAEAMTGVLAGPVSVSDVNTGTISFNAADNSGAVYRWNGEQWEKLEGSYYQSGRMCAVIDGGGIYVYGEAPGVVSPTVPAELALNGSYPNPFVAQAAISYSLPEAGRATLKVFDLSGRLIRTLADGDMAAADHTVVWDGRDASGNEVGAGVYFCRLEAAGHTATQKMLRIE